MYRSVTRVTKDDNIIRRLASQPRIRTVVDIEVLRRSAILTTVVGPVEGLPTYVETPPGRAQILVVAAKKELPVDARPQKAPRVHRTK